MLVCDTDGVLCPYPSAEYRTTMNHGNPEHERKPGLPIDLMTPLMTENGDFFSDGSSHDATFQSPSLSLSIASGRSNPAVQNPSHDQIWNQNDEQCPT